MKVTLNWLKQYVDFDWSPEQLSERLTMLGLEVEGVQKLGGEYEGVVVAQILSSEQHPNADKLSVCKVNDGKGERQIVCGAKNYKVGDKVPLILPNHSLPTPAGGQPFVIKVGKLRGVESQGMMCSAKELQMSEDADGLLILPADAKVGQPFAEHLGRSAGDVVFDLEITPNRPDLNSVIGIAREIAAVTGGRLRLPSVEFVEESAEPARELVDVRLEDVGLCPRYVARVIKGVKVAPSPDWLRATLEKVGLRSINNVVDVTNYVMLETGQPLHAFDYHLLTKRETDRTPVVVVRRASAGEKFVTLDGIERTLTERTLLIADETKAIALAGVMGGRNTEIREDTVDVLLESAYFNPQNIRATSKQLELRTDASYRFERGADPGITDWASRRAAQLILQTAGGKLAQGAVDAHPVPPTSSRIKLRFAKTNSLLGVSIPEADQVAFLGRLGLAVSEYSGEFCVVDVPSFRVDLKREADLIEEVARLYGVDRIPSTPPRFANGTNEFDSVQDQIACARSILVSMGLFEAQGQTLVWDRISELRRPDQVDVPGADWIRLANPLSSDMNVLRPSLIPGLLSSLSHNARHKTDDASLFEIGRVFANVDGKVRERRMIGLATMGARSAANWSAVDRDAMCDVYDFKGLLEEFFERFGLRGVVWQQAPAQGHYLECGQVLLGRQSLGLFGQLLPPLARRHDLRHAVFVGEFDLDLMLARRNASRSFKALPVFPSSRRDVAMLIDEGASHESVLAAIKQAKPGNLESVEIFDIFRGKGVPAGQKSVAYALTYRAEDRTLTDQEVNAAQEKVVSTLKNALKAVIRDS